jgi:phenylalanyl-tRNA synthetase beta chain
LVSGLEFVSHNVKKEFPQKIFEIGECFSIKEEKTKNRLAIFITHNAANFTEIKQVLDYLMRSLDIEYALKETTDGSFIDGRAGSIIVNNKNVGIIGELNPKVLSEWKLEMPIAALELDCEVLDIKKY